MGAGFIDVIDGYFTCVFTTLSRTGSPQTWPLAARLLPDGRFLLSTTIGRPQKAFNTRRNPKVSLLFSNPTGSGVANPGASSSTSPRLARSTGPISTSRGRQSNSI
jgi:hypothetical protein